MHIVRALLVWTLHLISHVGYLGLAGGMFGQAVGIPLPSEAMLAFSGYLAWSSKFTLPLVIVAGTAGDTLGALVAYGVGYYGGRPLLKRFGRLFFVRQAELERADRWFAKYGARAVFVSKLMPGIRAVASFPAGATRMSLGSFVSYTFLASAIWCTAFAYVGYVLGRNWVVLGHFFRPLSWLLIALLLAAIAAWFWLHARAERSKPPAAP